MSASCSSLILPLMKICFFFFFDGGVFYSRWWADKQHEERRKKKKKKKKGSLAFSIVVRSMGYTGTATTSSTAKYTHTHTHTKHTEKRYSVENGQHSAMVHEHGSRRVGQDPQHCTARISRRRPAAHCLQHRQQPRGAATRFQRHDAARGWFSGRCRATDHCRRAWRCAEHVAVAACNAGGGGSPIWTCGFC